MSVYRFRPGSRFAGDAAATYAELERIRRAQGALHPEAVVEAATDATSVLHPHFEWDDELAANEYRLMTARSLVRAIVVAETRTAEAAPVYVYDGTGYGPIAEVVTQPDRYLAALAAARADLEAAQRRVGDLLNAAKATKGKKGDVALILLAVQALQTANEAIHELH